MIAEKKQRGKNASAFWEKHRKTRKGNYKQAPGWSMGAAPGLLGAVQKL